MRSDICAWSYELELLKLLQGDVSWEAQALYTRPQYRLSAVPTYSYLVG